MQTQPPETRPGRVVPGHEPPPVWPAPDGRLRVGFAAPVHMDHGGCESWHGMLLPRLAACPELQIVGYAVRYAATDLGAIPLGVPIGTGAPAIISLARAVDILVCWGFENLSELVPARGDRRRPTVVLVNHATNRMPWAREVIRLSAPHADALVGVSAAALDDLPPEAADLPRRVIPNAIDPARLVPTRPRAEVRQEWGIESPICPVRIACLALSRLAEEKRLHLLADAIGPLAPPYQFLVAGDGPERPKLEGRRGVLLLGRRDDVADQLAGADLYLAASEYEGFGLSTAEAMAVGTPVISTPVGFLADKARHNLARIVPIAAGPEAWAAAIAADWADEPGRLARAERARRFVFEHFDATAWAQTWTDYLLSLAPSRPDPEQAVYPHPGPDGQPTTPQPPRAVASEEVRSARLAVCRTCDRLLPSGKCAACGCAGTTAERAASVYGVCPLGRWPRS